MVAELRSRQGRPGRVAITGADLDALLEEAVSWREKSEVLAEVLAEVARPFADRFEGEATRLALQGFLTAILDRLGQGDVDDPVQAHLLSLSLNSEHRARASAYFAEHPEALKIENWEDSGISESLEADFGQVWQRELSRHRAHQRRATQRELEAQKEVAKRDLARVCELLDLSLVEMGRLFGVSRQAVSAWLSEGVPAAQLPKLVTIVDIVELLARRLRPGRLGGVARKPATAYGGRTLLEMIEANRHEELLESVRRSFDWAATA